MQQDTIALLGDCTAGCAMAIGTIDALLPDTKDRRLQEKLRAGREDHQMLHKQASDMLARYGYREKAPSAMAKSMSWLKTNTRMTLRGGDTTVAYLVADGCDMGIKSLCKSRNQYSMANTQAINLAQELIRCEENLSASVRPYL